MSQTNIPTPASSVPRVESGSVGAYESGGDQILHLHKMSTTAGVGSQEYVAVNVVAVVAVLFGLASLLAIASPVLFVIPVTGVVLGLVSYRQIQNSNGTQTGKGLAILSLVLSGSITAGIFCVQGIAALHRRADQQAFAALADNYGQALHTRNFESAYDLFDSEFKNRVDANIFKARLAAIQRGGFIPPIDSVSWNGLADFHQDDTNTQTAESMMKLHFENGGEARVSVRFKKMGAAPWLIDNIYEHFPTPKPSAAPESK